MLLLCVASFVAGILVAVRAMQSQDFAAVFVVVAVVACLMTGTYWNRNKPSSMGLTASGPSCFTVKVA